MNDEIFSFEQCLIDPTKTPSGVQREALIHPMFIEFGQSGKTHHYDDVIAYLSQQKKTECCIEDFDMALLAETVVLATYRFITLNSITKRSSIWQKDERQWQLRFHQATLV